MRRNRGKAGTVTSKRQTATNQANACHSTGPRTPGGKFAVRLNAFRHGFLARDVVLPGEDADAFERTAGTRFGQTSRRWGRSRNVPRIG
jgi:hypothetical protein